MSVPTPPGESPPATAFSGNSTPRRLSPLTPVVRGPIFLLAVVGASWQQALDGGEIGVLGLLLVAVLLAGVVGGAVSWLRTTYWVEADELRIDTGVLSRQSRRIRIDRLQGIDIAQPLVARLFGLAELRFDVAGGDREGSLAFLPLAEARDVRRLLLERRDARRQAQSAPGSSASGPTATHSYAPGPTASHPSVPDPYAPGPNALGQAPSGPYAAPHPGWSPTPATPPAPDTVLARLDPQRLVVSLVLSAETFALLLTAGSLVLLAATTGEWAALGISIPVVFGAGLSLFNRLSGYYGFTVTDTPAGLHIGRGLLSLSSQTIALPRVQGVVISEPLLWRRLGWARLEVSLAGYGSTDGQSAEASSTIHPVGTRAEVDALARHVLRGLDPGRVPLEPAPRRSAWLDPLAWRKLAFGQDETLLVSRRGLVTRRTDVVPQARVQSLRATQGPLARLAGVVTLSADSAPGPVHVQGRHRLPEDVRDQLAIATSYGRRARAGQTGSGVSSGSGTPTAVSTHQNPPNSSGETSPAASEASESSWRYPAADDGADSSQA